jgi:hypothetical protein
MAPIRRLLRSVARRSVELLTQDVRMPGVPRRLLDHVHVDPAHRDLTKVWVRHNVVQLEARCGLPGQRALLVLLDDKRFHYLVRRYPEVAILIIIDPPQRR